MLETAVSPACDCLGERGTAVPTPPLAKMMDTAVSPPGNDLDEKDTAVPPPFAKMTNTAVDPRLVLVWMHEALKYQEKKRS